MSKDTSETAARREEERRKGSRLRAARAVRSRERVTAIPILTERRGMRGVGAEAIARVEDAVPPLTPVGLPLPPSQ